MPITELELAGRLRRAREQVGLTQEQVAIAVGLSRSSVTQLEGGDRSVSSLELERLAALYGRRVGDFLAPEFDADEVVLAKLRSAAQPDELDLVMKAGALSQLVLAELGQLEDLLDVDVATVAAPSYELPEPSSTWKAVRQGEAVAGEERRRLGLEDRPIDDISALVQAQGVRTFHLDLPPGVSGISLMDRRWGLVVVVSSSDARVRRRFSWSHEYGHVVMDRDQTATVSRPSDKKEFHEVRANAFAAEFLMPENGVRDAVEGLGKGRPSRDRVVVAGGGAEPVVAERRSKVADQALGLEDIVRLSHRFGVSRVAMLYRLSNLQIINQRLFDELARESEARGPALARAMGLDESPGGRDDLIVPEDFRNHILDLAARAFERQLIARSKVHEVAALVGVNRADVEDLLAARGLEERADVILPEGLE